MSKKEMKMAGSFVGICGGLFLAVVIGDFFDRRSTLPMSIRIVGLIVGAVAVVIGAGILKLAFRKPNPQAGTSDAGLRCWACDSSDTVLKGKTFMGGKKYLCSHCGFLNHTAVTTIDWGILIAIILLNVGIILWPLMENERITFIPNPIGIIVLVVIAYNFINYNKHTLSAAAKKHKDTTKQFPGS